MIVISADDVCHDFMADANELYSAKGGGVMDEATKTSVRELLASVERFCDKMHLPIAGGRPGVFRDEALAEVSCTGEILWKEFFALSRAISQELAERKLVFISPEKVQFLEQEALFGDEVNEAFPSAKAEIKDAGNCLAAELPNAAVFHLMRVAELGLRALAKSVKAKPPVQIEFATWGQVLAAVERELDDLKGKTVAKDRKAQFYSGLILEIRAFSHLWRNPVMHARSRYDDQQAQSAFNHVRAFMKKLSERVQESK
jgi:hypothetical protein